jgi:2-hydroxy-3-keto-5-methylthiopentenyl-1-phosphate phosphatase
VSSPRQSCHVFIDFDGTIVPDDVTDFVLESFADPKWIEIEKSWKAGHIGSRDCLRAQVDLIRATPEQIARAVSQRKVDPEFRPFVERCLDAGMHVSVVSDGFDLAIDAVLKKMDLKLPYFANHLEWLGDDKWRLGFPHMQDSCGTGAGNCKCSRIPSVPVSTIVVGDGRSDFCVAEKADFVLAKSALIEHCRRNQINHMPITGFAEGLAAFDKWSEPFLPRRSMRLN